MNFMYELKCPIAYKLHVLVGTSHLFLLGFNWFTKILRADEDGNVKDKQGALAQLGWSSGINSFPIVEVHMFIISESFMSLNDRALRNCS